MSTTLFESGDYTLTAFYGGIDRGPCLQLTFADGRFCQFNRREAQEQAEQFTQLAQAISMWISNNNSDALKAALVEQPCEIANLRLQLEALTEVVNTLAYMHELETKLLPPAEGET